jgi:hypothetical protein
MKLWAVICMFDVCSSGLPIHQIVGFVQYRTVQYTNCFASLHVQSRTAREPIQTSYRLTADGLKTLFYMTKTSLLRASGSLFIDRLATCFAIPISSGNTPLNIDFDRRMCVYSAMLRTRLIVRLTR